MATSRVQISVVGVRRDNASVSVYSNGCGMFTIEVVPIHTGSFTSLFTFVMVLERFVIFAVSFVILSPLSLCRSGERKNEY